MVKMCIADGHTYASARGTVKAGGVIEVDDAEAKALEQGGYAERVDAMPKYEPEPEPEVMPEARAPKRETTTSRPAKKREKAVETDR